MWIFNLFKKNDDDQRDAEKWVAKAIHAIAEEIAAGERQIKQVQAHQQDLLQKLADFEREANKLEEAAKQAIKEGQEQLARGYLMRKQAIMPQIEEYRNLCKEIETMIQRLLQRQAQQQIKLEKLKAKKATLSVELKQMQSLQKANEYWQKVMDELGFVEDAYLIEEAQLRLQQDETDDLAAFDQQLQDASPAASVEELKAAMQREEQQKQIEQQKKQEEQLYKQVAILLNTAESKAKHIRQKQEEDRKQQREELLSEFFKNNKDQKIKKTIEQFFRDNPEEVPAGQELPPSVQNPDNPAKNNKEDMIRAFFNQASAEDTKAQDDQKGINEHLKKQIEDFFNNKK